MPSVSVICENCGKKFNKNSWDISKSPTNYCSRSCSASSNNLKRNYKKKSYSCKHCGAKTENRKTRCGKCPDTLSAEEKSKIESIKDIIYTKHHRSSAFALIRSRARSVVKKLGQCSCQRCGYNEHIEVCHIKPISDFDENEKVSIVNDPDNLLVLCRNCHWEFDHRHFVISDL